MKRAGVLAVLCAALATAGAGTALGRPKPQASAQPAGGPAAPSAKPSAAPSAAASAAPAAAPQGGLPPGHPRVDDDGAPQPQQQRDPRMFQAPDDTAIDDPSLPAGVIVVTVKDADGMALPGAPVTLSILHSTVAKGESRERKSGRANERGELRFDGLQVGSGHSYQISTNRGGAVYQAPPVGLAFGAGKRAVIHAYDTSPNLEEMAVAMQGVVFLQLKEDSICVEQLLNVFNLGKVSWVANHKVELPSGFKAFNKQETQTDAHVEEASGGAAIKGTFGPGRNDLDFSYTVSLSGDASQTLRIRLPPHMMQMRVVAESSKTMGLRVAGFPEAQRTEGRDGKRLLITERQAARTEGGVNELEITLTGLPTPDPLRYVAAALAAVLLGAGLLYTYQHRSGEVDDDARQDLVEAREALLGEIVALEKAFKSGEVGPKTYARVRASLLEALSRIVTMLDEAKASRRPKAARA